MNRDRLVSLFVLLASVTVATIVVWLTFFRPPRESTVVREKPRTTVLVEPTLTPLRDSIRESKADTESGRTATRNPSPRKSDVGRSDDPRTSAHPTRAESPTRRTRKPKATTGKPKPRPTPQQPSPPPQSQPPRPPLDVQAPVPGSACVKGVGGLNC